MKARRYFWKLFLGNALLTVAIVIASVWLMRTAFRSWQDAEIARSLHMHAEVLESVLADHFGSGDASELRQLAERMARTDGRNPRVTFIAVDGTVLGDSHADPATMDSHANRPEFIAAMRDGAASRRRHSFTLSEELEYAAVRVGSKERPLGVVRVAMTMPAAVAGGSATERPPLFAIGVIGLVAVAALALGLARLWSRRIAAITDAAQALTQGDLSARAPIADGGDDDVAALARALNEMGEHLAAQFVTIERHRRTLEAIMSQLHEGVIVSRPDGRILLINPQAQRLLDLTSPRADGSFEGLPLEECVPRHDLQQLLAPRTEKAAGAGQPVWSPELSEINVQLPSSEATLTLRARAVDIFVPVLPDAGVLDAHPARPGRMLVLTDISELTRVIQIRTDFASNASHELRTPLAAIRAAVETLKGLNGGGAPGDVDHFLNVIERHSGRMQAMVADLLDLSRVESPAGHFQAGALRTRELLNDVRAGFAEALEEKKLNWEATVDPGCERLVASGELLRIVLRNLIENSVRFTGEGGSVRVSIACDDGEVAIAVADNGCGIPPEDQARVFERFYQVERARSGARRGTGLGLSIVRHAVAAMDGTVELSSQPGKGTTVTVRIPRAS